MLETMKAAIFDMDGTLLDSMTQWRRMNGAFVREMGIEPTEKQEADMMSMSGTMVVDYFRSEFGVDTDFEALCARACEAMEPVYSGGVPHKPGAAAYLKRLRARGVKCVIATATPARLAMIGLNCANLVSDLDYIFTTDMLHLNKSQNAFFERVSEIIGVPKEDCVMFEDSLYAMRGARNAGLGVVGITDATNARDREAIRACCDAVIAVTGTFFSLILLLLNYSLGKTLPKPPSSREGDRPQAVEGVPARRRWKEFLPAGGGRSKFLRRFFHFSTFQEPRQTPERKWGCSD